MMREARGLLNFACQVYSKQDAAGRTYIHEHPLSASSWKEEAIQELLAKPGISKINLDMCRFQLSAKGPDGKEGLVMKPTSLITNSEIIAERLAKRCLGDHAHVHLKGGKKFIKMKGTRKVDRHFTEPKMTESVP